MNVTRKSEKASSLGRLASATIADLHSPVFRPRAAASRSSHHAVKSGEKVLNRATACAAASSSTPRNSSAALRWSTMTAKCTCEMAMPLSTFLRELLKTSSRPFAMAVSKMQIISDTKKMRMEVSFSGQVSKTSPKQGVNMNRSSIWSKAAARPVVPPNLTLRAEQRRRFALPLPISERLPPEASCSSESRAGCSVEACPTKSMGGASGSCGSPSKVATLSICKRCAGLRTNMSVIALPKGYRPFMAWFAQRLSKLFKPSKTTSSSVGCCGIQPSIFSTP
mmetsp:Transcript_38720/g.97324  ORF Transcript_38720/g.97324 Transcript_38720/m.97324 type:complete len:280 (+) Transcript_38720:474-1313(+)